MKNRKIPFLAACFLCCSTLIHAQCQFGQRYSDPYLNIRKQRKVGDSSIVNIFANGSSSVFTLEKIDRENNYYYKRDAGYKSVVKIKFDAEGRVGMFYYEYNSGYWGSAAHGTEFAGYFLNGNLKFSGWKEKKLGGIIFYDSLDHAECDAKKLPRIKEIQCVKFGSKWYLVPGKKPEWSSTGFFKRRKLVRDNKKNIRRVEINWKDGFVIHDTIVREIYKKTTI